MSAFKELGLSNPVIKAISDLGFETPSDIQKQSIPLLLESNQDFIGLAQTGTGKTAAFGLPLLELVDPGEAYTQALILAPTRELGKQIAEQLKLYSRYLDRINLLPVYGGASIVDQMKNLKKPTQIIIATPGRLIDLTKRKAVKLNRLKYLILDEADEMLNMGFKEEIDKILDYTPDDKITWLFSATMPNEIKRIVDKYMDHPIEVRVNRTNTVNANIEHQYVMVKKSDKTEALTRFLNIDPNMRGVVFCRTRRETQALAEDLLKINYKADALHGDLSQAQRDRVMKRFKNHELQVLIATDVAARGIDVNDLTHVFHFTLPDQEEYYTHRSGRTARAGKKGTSIAFINGREKGRIERISRSLKITFESVLIPKATDIADKRIESLCLQIINSKVNGKLNSELFDKAQIIFEELSKEELLAKVLSYELEKLSLNNTKDLNDVRSKRGDGERRRDGRRSDRRRGDRFGRSDSRRSGGRFKRSEESKGEGKKSERRSSRRIKDEEREEEGKKKNKKLPRGADKNSKRGKKAKKKSKGSNGGFSKFEGNFTKKKKKKKK